MSKVIRIPESVFQRLQQLAVPLVDTPASVIARLLDFHDSQQNGEVSVIEGSGGPVQAKSVDSVREPESVNDPSTRASRQRGVVVKVEEQTFKAISVPDLYSQVLRFVCDNGHIEKLKPHLPVQTSSKRYVIAATPVHPGGKDFVIPVEYKGYYMEAGKDYKNGVNHLRKVLELCGLDLKYLG